MFAGICSQTMRAHSQRALVGSLFATGALVNARIVLALRMAGSFVFTMKDALIVV